MRLPLVMLEIFTAIAEHGSLRGAAESLGLTPSTVSHQLKNLETQIGTKLVVRTSRSLSLTEAGKALFEGTAPGFSQIAQGFGNARMAGQRPRGPLNVAMPELAYHAVLAEALRRFQTEHPDIELELSIGDGLVDILKDGRHAGIRSGEIISENMVAIRLTPPLRLAVAGAPGYFSINGIPQSPQDLQNHNCIRYRFISSGQFAPWVFSGEDADYTIAVTGSTIVNSLPVAVNAAIEECGLVFLLRDYIKEEIDTGKLQVVLDDHATHTAGLFLYFPTEYRNYKPLRALIDFL
ncbi:LysR family transcriptional regulator [Shimia abyssi]|uniref:LysR family transcriptional regulator n=1 Tax=Shimia abyssi TaxID=1662395 RepID=A0A2P8FJ33_9RHOB|nr:LysR family transcriptional regulator [Shimia abyssi]PSL21709.1 LysR family transcriptional regulator [Shimia abyssi]